MIEWIIENWVALTLLGGGVLFAALVLLERRATERTWRDLMGDDE